jgi:hypothetical protein
MALANSLHLDTLIPQIQQFLNPQILQQLQSQFLGTIISAVGNNWNLNTIAQQLQQIVTQLVPQAAQMRIDWDQVGQQALNGLVGALPSIAIGLVSLFGKRDLPATDARFQVTMLFPQIQQLLNGDQFQQLQSQFLNTMLTALGSHTNLNTIAQQLQELFTQFVPQMAQMRINWEEVAESALNGLVGALPGILVGALSLFGKRDATRAFNVQQLLSTLSVDKLAQIVQTVLNVDHATVNKVLAKLRQLLQQFFSGFQGRFDFDQLAEEVLALVSNLLPTLGNSLASLFG